MFLKTSDINAFIVCTSELTKEEYLFLTEKFGNYPVVYLIPYEEEKPSFLSDEQFIIKENYLHRIFGNSLIKQALTLINIPSNNCVVISKNIKSIKPFLFQPVGTVLINTGKIDYEDIGYLPDIKITSFEELDNILNKKIGFFSEICSTIMPDGTSYGNSGFIFTFEMIRDDYKFDVIAGGRYFNSKHECFHSHQLSHRINKSKRDNSQNRIFESIYIPIINHIKETSQVDGITRVPNRPGKLDRLKPIVQSIAKNTNLEDLSDQLYCPDDYPPHKGLSSNMRFDNVKDRFKVKTNFSGKHIVIIDDVFTTGATLFECAKQLYNNDAGKVTAVVLGVNQFPNEFTQRFIHCPECNGNMHLKINKQNNRAFYGCENYFNDNNRCKYSENFITGWQRIIEENSFQPENSTEPHDELFF